MRRFSLHLLIASLALTSTACSSSEADSQPSSPPSSSATANAPAPAALKQTLITNLKRAGLDAKVSEVRSTEIAGLYWVTFADMPPVFSSADGQYLIQGDALKLGQGQIEDLSAQLQQADAKVLLASVPRQDLIIFKPNGTPKAVAYVFTDADCGYCRKLHSEINDILAKGIEIRYLAWPRSPQSMPDMNAVWCSEDRNSAMTQAKSGLPVQAAACKNPVIAQRELGAKIGVNGTPAIYSVDGKYLGGYLPAAALAKSLGL